jgi:triosephosphate isomerase (TIM)
VSFLLAANWKMHKGPEQARQFFAELSSQSLPSHVAMTFFVPSVNALTTSELSQSAQWSWGPQNIYPAAEGAFTGETSPMVMAELGATRALVGHSERRQLFAETNEVVEQKVKACFQFHLRPMLCVGENWQQRKSGQTIEVVRQQLEMGLKGVDPDAGFDIAYEPVWAIGTGEVATQEQVAEVHAFIRGYLQQNFSSSSSRTILYGGSVKAQNAAELSAIDDVQGFLVGGASLQVSTFCEIAQVCHS